MEKKFLLTHCLCYNSEATSHGREGVKDAYLNFLKINVYIY